MWRTFLYVSDSKLDTPIQSHRYAASQLTPYTTFDDSSHGSRRPRLTRRLLLPSGTQRAGHDGRTRHDLRLPAEAESQRRKSAV